MIPYQAKIKLQEIAQRMKEIKGKKMNDFDFDNLLDEIEETVGHERRTSTEGARPK